MTAREAWFVAPLAWLKDVSRGFGGKDGFKMLFGGFDCVDDGADGGERRLGGFSESS
jgi:hypothetical protein